jgi:hypothetical protein
VPRKVIQNHSADANADCPLGPAGKTVPGGFAGLYKVPSQCGGLVNLAVSQSGSDTGNDGPSNCDTILNKWASELANGRPVIVLLPVYDDVTGTGSGGSYHLNSFAAFSVHGWAFSGSDRLPMVYNATPSSGLECKGNCRGIIGKFVKYVSSRTATSWGRSAPTAPPSSN